MISQDLLIDDGRQCDKHLPLKTLQKFTESLHSREMAVRVTTFFTTQFARNLMVDMLTQVDKKARKGRRIIEVAPAPSTSTSDETPTQQPNVFQCMQDVISCVDLLVEEMFVQENPNLPAKYSYGEICIFEDLGDRFSRTDLSSCKPAEQLVSQMFEFVHYGVSEASLFNELKYFMQQMCLWLFSQASKFTSHTDVVSLAVKDIEEVLSPELASLVAKNCPAALSQQLSDSKNYTVTLPDRLDPTPTEAATPASVSSEEELDDDPNRRAVTLLVLKLVRHAINKAKSKQKVTASCMTEIVKYLSQKIWPELKYAMYGTYLKPSWKFNRLHKSIYGRLLKEWRRPELVLDALALQNPLFDNVVVAEFKRHILPQKRTAFVMFLRDFFCIGTGQSRDSTPSPSWPH